MMLSAIVCQTLSVSLSALAWRREDLEMDQSFCRVTRRYDPAEVAKYALANKFALAVRASSIGSALGAFYVRRELIWKNMEETAPDSPAGVGRCVRPPLP
jgi:hypothetical protein